MANEQTTASLRLGVSEFIALTNQTLEYAYPYVEVEGEVASFKLNQGKYVFFDLKDDQGSIACFMMAWQLRQAIEDGMKIVVGASPKLTQWGKFSLTVQHIRPSGEGSLKKSFELLKAKLEDEGLFKAERKRALPAIPRRIAVITSTEAAGYTDFVKVLNDRWGGALVEVAHVQVQGVEAPDQIIRALQYFNAQEELAEVIVIVRGGGSAADLNAFNDELLVREIARSRIPTMVGVGHEVDVSLADLAADVRAATPSNAAQLLVPDRREVAERIRQKVRRILPHLDHALDSQREAVRGLVEKAYTIIEQRYETHVLAIKNLRQVIEQLDPMVVLRRGYALIRGALQIGAIIEIEKSDAHVTAEVKDVRKK